MRTKPTAIAGPMDEVIDLEVKIRMGLNTTQHVPADLIADAKAILAGKPTKRTGSRLDRLRTIAAEFSAK